MRNVKKNTVKKHHYLGLLLLLFMPLAMAAWADSAPVLCDGLDGADVKPIRNHHIRMVREIVDIDCAWTTYTVEANFWFKNTTRKIQKVQLGFPMDYRVSCDSVGNDGINYPVLDAPKTVKVDWNGQPIKFAWGKIQKYDIPHASIINDSNDYMNRQWICWTAQFNPGEECHNRVSYTYPAWYMDSGSHNDACAFSFIKYILKSGAGWNGPIGSALIRINYNHPIPHYFYFEKCAEPFDASPTPAHLKIYPPGYQWNKEEHVITWNFRNLVPDKDIYFGWAKVPNFKKLDQAQKINFKDAPTTPSLADNKDQTNN